MRSWPAASRAMKSQDRPSPQPISKTGTITVDKVSSNFASSWIYPAMALSAASIRQSLNDAGGKGQRFCLEQVGDPAQLVEVINTELAVVNGSITAKFTGQGDRYQRKQRPQYLRRQSKAGGSSRPRTTLGRSDSPYKVILSMRS